MGAEAIVSEVIASETETAQAVVSAHTAEEAAEQAALAASAAIAMAEVSAANVTQQAAQTVTEVIQNQAEIEGTLEWHQIQLAEANNQLSMVRAELASMQEQLTALNQSTLPPSETPPTEIVPVVEPTPPSEEVVSPAVESPPEETPSRVSRLRFL